MCTKKVLLTQILILGMSWSANSTFYPNFNFRYVLKPQREGGGNNVYGDDIRPFLKVDIVFIELDHQLHKITKGD